MNYVGRYLADKKDLIDPWGQEIKLGATAEKDRTVSYYVFTLNPIDGSLIESRRGKK